MRMTAGKTFVPRNLVLAPGPIRAGQKRGETNQQIPYIPLETSPIYGGRVALDNYPYNYISLRNRKTTSLSLLQDCFFV